MPYNPFLWQDEDEYNADRSQTWLQAMQERLQQSEAARWVEQTRDAAAGVRDAIDEAGRAIGTGASAAGEFLERGRAALSEPATSYTDPYAAGVPAPEGSIRGGPAATLSAMTEEALKPNVLTEGARGLGARLGGGEPGPRGPGEVAVDVTLNLPSAAAAGLHANLPESWTPGGGGPSVLGMGVGDIATAAIPGKAPQALLSGGIGLAGRAGVGTKVGEALAERVPDVAGAIERGAGRLIEAGRGMTPGKAPVVPPDVARRLPGEAKIPDDPDFLAAVESAGGRVTPEGIEFNFIRHQKPEQPLAEASRGGVFYEPKRPGSRSDYAGESADSVGGPQRVEGPTVVRSPLVIDSSQGDVFEQALAHLDARTAEGARVTKEMVQDAIQRASSLSPGRQGQAMADAIKRLGGAPEGVPDILRNMTHGEQWYALNENILAEAARRKGYDSIFTIRRAKNGKVTVREAMDLCEAVYPSPGGEFALRPEFGGEGRSAYQRLVRAIIDETGDANHAEYLASGIRRGDYLGNLNAEHIKGTLGKDADALIEAVRREGAAPAGVPPGAMGIIGDMGGAAQAKPSDRYYHGTAGAFDRPDPAMFNMSDSHGPAMYMTESPGMAGKYSVMRAGEDAAGANVRPIDVPRDLRLLDDAQAVPDEVVAAVERAFGADAADAISGRRLDIGYDKLRGIVGGGDSIDLKYGSDAAKRINEVLARAGYDGFSYTLKGGVGETPVRALAIFPESLDKIKNTLSGTPGGLLPAEAPGPGPIARAASQYGRSVGYGAGAGAIGEAQQEGATPGSIAEAALKGGLMGGARGLAGRQATQLAAAREAAEQSPGAMSLLGGALGSGTTTVGDWLKAIRYNSMLSSVPGIMTDVVGTGSEVAWRIGNDILFNPKRGFREAGAAVQAIPAAFDHFKRTLADAVAGRPSTAAALGATGGAQQSLASQTTGLAKAVAIALESPGAVRGSFDAFYSHIAEEMGQAAGMTPQDAQKFAERLTFKGELGDWGKKLEDFIKGTGPLGHLMMPFIRTPYHITARAIDRSPIGAVKLGVDIARGKYRARPQQLSLFGGAQQVGGLGPAERPLGERAQDAVTGSLLWGGMLYEAYQGNVSGSGPDSAAERRMLQAQGWQPFSVKVGDRWISYANWGPFGQMLGTTASLADAWRYRKPEDDMYTTGLNALRRFGRLGVDQTYLRGLATVFNAITDPGRYGGDALTQTMGSIIPFGGGLASTARAMDPLVRRPEEGNLGQAVSARLPWARQTVPIMRDVAGRPVPNEQAGVLGFFDPRRMSTERPHAALQEMERLGIDMPSVGDRIGDVKLKPPQARVYRDNAQQMRGALAERLIASGPYQRASDEEKTRLMNAAMRRAASWAGQAVSPGASEEGREFLGPTVRSDPSAAIPGYLRALEADEQIRALRAKRFRGLSQEQAAQVSEDRALIAGANQAMGEARGRLYARATLGGPRYQRALRAREDPSVARRIAKLRRDSPEWSTYLGSRALQDSLAERAEAAMPREAIG